MKNEMPKESSEAVRWDQKALVREVDWRDLLTLTKWERFVEWTLPIPWLLGSWGFAYHGYVLLALPCSFFFFLTGLRQSHNGFHRALGLGAKGTGFFLRLNSMLMLASMHAVQWNHLRHHKHCLDEHDIEGKPARMKAWQALLYGPVNIVHLHAAALKGGRTRDRKLVSLELGLIGLLLLATVVSRAEFLIYHVAVMIIGECMTAFFAVWTVHHDCEPHEVARTQRGWLKNKLSYSMFYHLEHHLFPAVPTIKLDILAERLDEKKPEPARKFVF